MSTVKQQLILNTNQPEGEACIANINPAERRKRLITGIVAFVAAAVILAVMAFTGMDRLWRLPLALLFFVAATGYFQWRDKTCVAFAVLNSRKVGDKMEKIEDSAELARVRKQARQVQIKSLLAAIPLTTIALLLPVLG